MIRAASGDMIDKTKKSTKHAKKELEMDFSYGAISYSYQAEDHGYPFCYVRCEFVLGFPQRKKRLYEPLVRVDITKTTMQVVEELMPIVESNIFYGDRSITVNELKNNFDFAIGTRSGGTSFFTKPIDLIASDYNMPLDQVIQEQITRINQEFPNVNLTALDIFNFSKYFMGKFKHLILSIQVTEKIPAEKHPQNWKEEGIRARSYYVNTVTSERQFGKPPPFIKAVFASERPRMRATKKTVLRPLSTREDFNQNLIRPPFVIDAGQDIEDDEKIDLRNYKKNRSKRTTMKQGQRAIKKCSQKVRISQSRRRKSRKQKSNRRRRRSRRINKNRSRR